MADYQKMYLNLFNEVTKAVTILQNAQQLAEETYINSPECALHLLAGLPKQKEKEDS